MKSERNILWIQNQRCLLWRDGEENHSAVCVNGWSKVTFFLHVLLPKMKVSSLKVFTNSRRNRGRQSPLNLPNPKKSELNLFSFFLKATLKSNWKNNCFCIKSVDSNEELKTFELRPLTEAKSDTSHFNSNDSFVVTVFEAVDYVFSGWTQKHQRAALVQSQSVEIKSLFKAHNNC